MKRKRQAKRKSLNRKTVLLLITGSIAAYKIGDLIQDLRECGAQVKCVMTEAAKKFTTPLVIRALSGQPVYHDFFDADGDYDVLHTSLAEEADAIVVAPASADFLAKAAAGMADDLATCILLATDQAAIFSPAMNDLMYEHPLTQRNLKTLSSLGHTFVQPEEGHLVCGKEAYGHIADHDAIVNATEQYLKKPRKLKR